MARRGHHTLGEIKDMVLVAAEDLVVEGGLTQLRVRNIAVKIGYTVGSIYMVFDNMDDLILHVKGRTLDELAEEMESTHCSSPGQCLEKLASTYIHFASQNFNRWTMVFDHRLPESVEVPEWYQRKVDRLHSIFEAQFALLQPILTSSQRKQTALAFLGGIHGICVFMLTTHLGGLKEKDMKESAALLAKRFVHDRMADPVITSVTKPKATKKGLLLVTA